MTEKQRQFLLALALVGGGALLNEGGRAALSTAEAQGAPVIQIHRACVGKSDTPSGVGIEICGRATVPSIDGGGEIIIDQGCVSGEPKDPALALQVMGIVQRLWSDERKLTVPDGGSWLAAKDGG